MAVEVWATCVKILGDRQFDSITAMLSFMICFSESLVAFFTAKFPIETLFREILGELSPEVCFKLAKVPPLMS